MAVGPGARSTEVALLYKRVANHPAMVCASSIKVLNSSMTLDPRLTIPFLAIWFGSRQWTTRIQKHGTCSTNINISIASLHAVSDATQVYII